MSSKTFKELEAKLDNLTHTNTTTPPNNMKELRIEQIQCGQCGNSVKQGFTLRIIADGKLMRGDMDIQFREGRSFITLYADYPDEVAHLKGGELILNIPGIKNLAVHIAHIKQLP